MLVTDDAFARDGALVERCRAAERGGVTCIQLRLKLAPSRELLTLARVLRTALRIPLLVNDRADVALAAGALGAHLGPEDVPLPLIRGIAPPQFVLGASVGSLEETAAGRGADYWGVGPVRGTATKPGAGEPLGLAGFAALVRRAEGKPCLAIGGVRPEDVAGILAAGGAGVAVVSGILGADDVESAAAEYRSAVEAAN